MFRTLIAATVLASAVVVPTATAQTPPPVVVSSTATSLATAEVGFSYVADGRTRSYRLETTDAVMAMRDDNPDVPTVLEWQLETPVAGVTVTPDGIVVVDRGVGTADVTAVALAHTPGDTDDTKARVTVTVSVSKPAAPVNPPTDIKPTTPADIGIIAAVVVGVLGVLAGLVQALVPGGWPQVIGYFTGQ